MEAIYDYRKAFRASAYLDKPYCAVQAWPASRGGDG